MHSKKKSKFLRANFAFFIAIFKRHQLGRQSYKPITFKMFSLVLWKSKSEEAEFSVLPQSDVRRRKNVCSARYGKRWYPAEVLLSHGNYKHFLAWSWMNRCLKHCSCYKYKLFWDKSIFNIHCINSYVCFLFFNKAWIGWNNVPTHLFVRFSSKITWPSSDQ